MAIELKIVGASFAEILEDVIDISPVKTPQQVLDGISLQDLLAYVTQRADGEGFDIAATKKSLSAADKRKEEARAKLKGDLEGSVAQTKVSTPEEDAQPDATTTPEIVEAKKAAATKKVNGTKSETPEQMKERVVMSLQELFAKGKKAEVKRILANFGDGAKNFHGVPVEKFPEIEKAIGEIV
jgi:hypothetical protein